VLPVAAALAVVLILQPVKSYYREIQWSGQGGDILSSWSEAFDRYRSDTRSNFFDPQDGRTSDRVGGLSAAAYVTEMVPAVVPHSEGETYVALGYSFIPRIVWPNKPNMTKAGVDAFTIALGLTDRETAERSTTALSLTSHGYYAHGFAGAIAWMALLGVMLALLSVYFDAGLAGTVGGVALLSGIALQVEGGFVNIFGGIWQSVATATVIPWILRAVGARRVAPSPLRPARPARRSSGT
jgi:hypothetical protein